MAKKIPMGLGILFVALWVISLFLIGNVGSEVIHAIWYGFLMGLTALLVRINGTKLKLFAASTADDYANAFLIGWTSYSVIMMLALLFGGLFGNYDPFNGLVWFSWRILPFILLFVFLLWPTLAAIGLLKTAMNAVGSVLAKPLALTVIGLIILFCGLIYWFAKDKSFQFAFQGHSEKSIFADGNVTKPSDGNGFTFFGKDGLKIKEGEGDDTEVVADNDAAIDQGDPVVHQEIVSGNTKISNHVENGVTTQSIVPAMPD